MERERLNSTPIQAIEGDGESCPHYQVHDQCDSTKLAIREWDQEAQAKAIPAWSHF